MSALYEFLSELTHAPNVSFVEVDTQSYTHERLQGVNPKLKCPLFFKAKVSP